MSNGQKPIQVLGDQAGISPNDLKFIQGDIVVGMAKKLENFVFFTIKDPQQFRAQLQVLKSQITTADGARKFRERIKKSEELLANNAFNIAFSAKGLKALGADLTKLNDAPFSQGQLASASRLGDDVSKWDKLFKGQSDQLKGDIHGVMIVVASDPTRLKGAMDNVTKMFQIGQQNAIINIETVEGHVRELEKGHEHFGFKDGITQPMIDGLSEVISDVSDTTDNAPPIDPGVILLGRRGDTDELTNKEMKDLKLTDEKDRIRKRERPGWALDGSFMVFRKLEQRVPEFNADMVTLAKPMGITPELLGARLVGRWKSGAPVQNNPTTDPVKKGDTESAEATSQDFKFVITDQQKSCPFVAHIRKTNPRDDLKEIDILPTQKDLVIPHRILRRGIQYGPDVENDKQTDSVKRQRGLLFACYQSSITDGFEFIQNRWVSDPTFPPNASVKGGRPGVDPVLGTPRTKSDRFITGANPRDLDKPLDLQKNEWVVSRGGEYFFSPGIKAFDKFPFSS